VRGTRLKTQWPSLKDARAFIDYDPNTGDLTHKARTPDMFPQGYRPHAICAAWNKRNAGKTWGAVAKSGHIKGRIKDADVYAHHVAWALHYGEWPTDHLNHLNGDPADNRIVNLRQVSQAEVVRNQSLHRDNRSGRIGVFQRSDTGKWVAKISRRGSQDYEYLGGAFDTLEDASEARAQAEARKKYHANHGRRPSRFTKEQNKEKRK